MKSLKNLWIAVAILALPTFAMAGTAQLQVIHNSADPGAAQVDVYVNGDLLLNDFAFRTATPFVEVPAGVELNIGVAPGTSAGPEDILATFPVTLADGGRYLAVANGVLDPDAFAENPDGRSTGFTLFLQDHMASKSWWGTVALRAVHGASDAPAVDLIVRNEYWDRTLYSGVGYGDIGATKVLLASDRIIDVTLPGQPDVVVASYQAPLKALARQAFVVFASGFLDPSMNQDGPAFGLFATLADGSVVELPMDNPMARLQVIHNAADPGAAEVDIYVNGDLLLDDFAFRAATPFIDVPAGVELNIGVAPGTSTGAGDVIAEFPVTLMNGKTYVAMATGVLDPGAFAMNPDGVDIGFTIKPLANAREKGKWGRVAVVAYHGATDAPRVDIRKDYDRDGMTYDSGDEGEETDKSWWYRGALFGDLGYGEFSDYRYLRARNYTLNVTPAGDEQTVVASFQADLRGLEGGAAVVFASGFLSPADNQDGMAFGLFAALPDGNVIALPAAADDDDTRGDIVEVASTEAMVEQNYPNPFNPMTTIAFTMPAKGRVSLKVFDVRGRLVDELVNGEREAGRHAVNFDGTRLSSGLYMYQVTTKDQTITRQMTLLK
jgi:hypothetical protein